MSCDGYNNAYVKRLAAQHDIEYKTVDEACAELKDRGLISPPKPEDDWCKSRPLARLLYQARELEIPHLEAFTKFNRQELCEEIRQTLDATGKRDKYTNVKELTNNLACNATSQNQDVREVLEQLGVNKLPMTVAELKDSARKLGIVGYENLDKSTLCFLIRNEIIRLEKGKAPRPILPEKKKKALLQSTYDLFLIHEEEKLNICQLSRALTKERLTPQQVLPALYLSENNYNGIILAHNVGTGKTYAAINTSQVLLRRNIVKRVLVITPTSLQYNFIDQFKKYNKDLATDPRYTYYTPTSFLIGMQKNEIPCGEDTLLIIDEAHNYRTDIGSMEPYTELKGDGSRVRAVFKFLSQCVDKVVKVLLLTATPFVNQFSDIENLLAMVQRRAPRKFKHGQTPEERYTQFMEMFSDPRTYSAIHYYDTPEDQKELFPRTEHKKLFFKMTDPYYDKYLRIQKDQATGIMYQKGLTVFYNGVRRASNRIDVGEYSQKLSELLQLIYAEVQRNPKIRILVYSAWIEAGLTSIKQELEQNGVTTLAVMGNFSKAQRRLSVEQFNSGEANVLLISRAGGEGLDLKQTNVVYIVDPSWNDAAVQQIIGRAVRRNSHKDLPPEERLVRIYTLILLKPLEANVMVTYNRNKKDARLRQAYEDLFENLEKVGKYPDSAPPHDKEADDMMSIDLYLNKYMKKKQIELDHYLDSIKLWSSQVFDPWIERIEPALDVEEEPAVSRLQPLPEASSLDPVSGLKNLLSDPDVRIYKVPDNVESLDTRIDYDATLAKRYLRDLPAEVRAKGTQTLRDLSDNTPIKYFAIVDGTRVKLVLFHKNDAKKVIRQNIIIS